MTRGGGGGGDVIEGWEWCYLVFGVGVWCLFNVRLKQVTGGMTVA